MNAQLEPTERDAKPLLFIVLLIAILALAAAVRIPNLGYNSLSHGETDRLNIITRGDINELRWFPPMLIPINEALLAVSGTSEFLIRLPNAILGVACVAVLFVMVRRVFDSWSAVCVAAVAAVHPILIEWGSRLAKEFAVEAMMTVLIAWVAIAACREMTARRIIAFAATAVVALSLTYAAPLHIAAWLPVLLYSAWKRDDGRRSLRWVVGVSILLIPLGGAWYYWLAGNPARGNVVACYDEWFKPWPAGYTLAALSSWAYKAVYGSLRILTGMEWVWPPLCWLLGIAGLFCGLAAVTVCWRRCRELCVASVLLGLGTLAAGALKQWPVGAVHTITFAVPLACIFIGCGLRHIAGRLGWNLAPVLLVACCVFVPAARAVKAAAIQPVALERTRPVFDRILAEAQDGDGVFVYYGVRRAFEFYWPRLLDEAGRSPDSIAVLVQPGDDRGEFDAFSERLRAFTAEHKRVWFVFCHAYRDEGTTWVGHVEANYDVVDTYVVDDASVRLLRLARSDDKPSDGVAVRPRADGE